MDLFIYVYTYHTLQPISRSACGKKVPHVTLARWNYFDEGVCVCYAGALQIRMSSWRIQGIKVEPANNKHNQN